MRGDRFEVEPCAGEELARVLRAIDPRGLEVDRLEAGLGELFPVLLLGFLQRAGDAPDPQLDAAANLRRHLTADDDVGDGEAAARTQHAEPLGERAVLVPGQVDDTVRDDHVHGGLGQRDVFQLAP